MKNFDSRVYSIADFVEWRETDLLDLSPDFQRRSVWSEKAKSYLVDTIIRGKPMPKILITQDLKSRRNVRIVVDGQQRLRAILEFIDGNFRVSRAHNKEFARRTFDELPADIKNAFLKYEVGVDLLFDVPYEDLLDIFARINTYTVKLNSQEVLNATYLGYFKQAAYELGYKYVKYMLEGGILTKAQVSRMAEAELASDLLATLCGGVQSNKAVENFYKQYEDEPDDIDTFVSRFNEVMSNIGEIYTAIELANTNWVRPPMFYTMFTSIAHGLYGLNNLGDTVRPHISPKTIGRLRVRFDEISAKYDEYTHADGRVPEDYSRFLERARRGTTDTAARVERARFVCNQLARE